MWGIAEQLADDESAARSEDPPHPDLRHRLAGSGRQRLTEAIARNEGVGRLDPETLAAWARRRMLPPPDRGGEHRAGDR